MLLKTASSNAVAVVVTNHQMQSSVDRFDNRVVPLGGYVMSYANKYRMHLDGSMSDLVLNNLARMSGDRLIAGSVLSLPPVCCNLRTHAVYQRECNSGRKQEMEQ